LADGTIRLDKWLWQARFVKTRALAADLAGGGHLRLNGQHCTKAGHVLRVGDVLTFPLAGRVRVVRVTDLGQRRGPATEAAGLYDNLAPLE
jgi:ribosome-associated heat shock protein Hsp15